MSSTFSFADPAILRTNQRILITLLQWKLYINHRVLISLYRNRLWCASRTWPRGAPQPARCLTHIDRQECGELWSDQSIKLWWVRGKSHVKTDLRKKRPCDLWNALNRQHARITSFDPYIMPIQGINCLCRCVVPDRTVWLNQTFLILGFAIFETFLCFIDSSTVTRHKRWVSHQDAGFSESTYHILKERKLFTPICHVLTEL